MNNRVAVVTFGPSPNSGFCYLTEVGLLVQHDAAVEWCAAQSAEMLTEYASSAAAEWNYITSEG